MFSTYSGCDRLHLTLTGDSLDGEVARGLGRNSLSLLSPAEHDSAWSAWQELHTYFKTVPYIVYPAS